MVSLDLGFWVRFFVCEVLEFFGNISWRFEFYFYFVIISDLIWGIILIYWVLEYLRVNWR